MHQASFLLRQLYLTTPREEAAARQIAKSRIEQSRAFTTSGRCLRDDPFAARVFWLHRYECARVPLPPLLACHFSHAAAPAPRRSTRNHTPPETTRSACLSSRRGQAPDLRIRGVVWCSRRRPRSSSRPAVHAGWPIPKGTELLKAIRAIEADGLTPDDYHLAVLTRRSTRTARSADAARRRRTAGTDGDAPPDDRPRALRAGAAGLARQAVERRSARGAPPLDVTLDQLARSSAIAPDRGAEAESLHLRRPQAGARAYPRAVAGPAAGRRSRPARRSSRA